MWRTNSDCTKFIQSVNLHLLVSLLEGGSLTDRYLRVFKVISSLHCLGICPGMNVNSILENSILKPLNEPLYPSELPAMTAPHFSVCINFAFSQDIFSHSLLFDIYFFVGVREISRWNTCGIASLFWGLLKGGMRVSDMYILLVEDNFRGFLIADFKFTPDISWHCYETACVFFIQLK